MSIEDLHSNMVRFIMHEDADFVGEFLIFTFQYGQIYYKKYWKSLDKEKAIYIPIWLDLL